MVVIRSRSTIFFGMTLPSVTSPKYVTMVTWTWSYMTHLVSKSRFKAKALELFRQVETTGKPIIITDRGTPVLKLAPYREDPEGALKALRETVVKYTAPTKPVGSDDWKSNR